MPPASDDDRPAKPSTPRKQPNRSSHADPKTPVAKTSPSPGDAPNSAPAAAGRGQANRSRSNSKKQEPTLLSDFFLGRQSAARVAADRKRRQSIEAVRAEMRHEMRQGAVRRLQQPGGVKDRVQHWQHNHAAAMSEGNPNYAATEPSDVAFASEDLESVTEEDRVRIKMRQRKRSAAKTPSAEPGSKSSSASDDAQSQSPPKKRVVSDDNWMRARNRKSAGRKVSTTPPKGSSPHGSAGSFVLRPTPNPPVSTKIKAWASKLDTPDGYESGSQVGSAGSQPSPSKQRPKSYANDGIHVKGSPNPSTVVRDDGIRVRPTSTASDVTFPGQTYRPPRLRSKSNAGSGVSALTGDHSALSAPSSEGTRRAGDRRNVGKGIGDRLNDYISNLDTPTKQKEPRPMPSHRARPPKPQLGKKTAAVDVSVNLGDNSSNLSSLRPESDLSSNITAKTLADISGDIPFGHSAFSELDLSVGGTGKSRPKKANVDRNTSLRTVPNVLKKVMEEGKRMMKDMNEPAREATPNKPPSIEKWLNTTVDPFIDAPAPVKKERKDKETSKETSKDAKPIETAEAEKPKAAADQDGPAKPQQRRAQTESSHKPKDDSVAPTQTSEETATPTEKETRSQGETEAATEPTTPTSTGLKRRRAKRSTSSPLKGGRKEFLDMFKEALKGESATFSGPPKTYQSQEHRKFDPHDDDSLLEESVLSSAVTGSTETSTQGNEAPANSSVPQMAGPRFRPPTKGHHELSTILSDDGSSAGSSNLTDSDLASRASQSTATQSTDLSRNSNAPAPKKPECTLKRRLTRHSDLMSVLSLPDNNAIPQDVKSNRSRPSLRKNKGIAGDVTDEELLKEFIEDENLYGRELKTLVDGVLPVLLSDVVSHTNATNLFGGVTSEHLAGKVSKSVVGMGVALEKLKNAHKKAPVSDIRRLAHWAHGVVPIYNSYLSAWRLGFQDMVVNLAPLENRPDEQDSLLDALPRNENGDVVNANGERVAVAHLLKRPLVRIKQMTKLIKCLDNIIATQDTSQLLRDFEELQDKARRRNREEIARITDEEAANTDTTRSRDLRTLETSAATTIDPSLQVNAKDTFSLDLAHSSGQRLECQVELVQRDSQQSDEEGDLLIREVGEGRRPYLLFAPISMSMCSARTGDGNCDMVVMIRGTHMNKPWHELLTLSTDNEDQILDWLDLLPLNPIPPREPEPSVVGDDEVRHKQDVPVGASTARNLRPSSPLVQSPRSPVTPTKNGHAGHGSYSQSTPEGMDTDKTPTQDSCAVVDDGHDALPKPLNIIKSPPPSSYREDGAPPPPAHRVLPSTPPADQSDPTRLSPLQDPQISNDKVRRRRSSPLKHEYLPSDRSSASSSFSDEDSDGDSSDDDIESMDIPETELGMSIAKDVPPPPVIESVLSQSDCSLTPSNSASQAGLFGPKVENEENTTRFLASLSRWSDRGVWKDLTQQPCAIVVSGGLIEGYSYRATGDRRKSAKLDDRPLIALDLTPIVLIRQSTALDLEVRSSVQTHSRLYETYSGGNFRFRCHSAPECFGLYMAVHHARLNNQKFIQLENEARFKSFGERNGAVDGDGKSSGKRRSWFGRKNSYRGSVRAPAQSAEGASTSHSSTPSASSFLKRLMASGNNSFNLEHSSVDRQSQYGSGRNSLYTSGSSSASGTPPRSPSVSIENSGGQPVAMDSENIRIRLHLLVSSAKWEDYGNCILQIRRPPPGWRQALRADHGLEKRVTVIALPKKESEQAKIVLDAVLGSGCFSGMGSRGIVCGVWEEALAGVAPDKGGTGGNIKKWCFQLATAGEASWVLRLVHQEVVRA